MSRATERLSPGAHYVAKALLAHFARSVLLVLATAALFAGCGSSGTTASIPPEPQDVEPNKGSPGADEPSHGKVDIAIGARAFERPVMRVTVGQIVVWTNEDDVGHTVRAVDGGIPRSGLIPPRGRFEFTALKGGRIIYRCVVHPEMEGELIVEAPLRQQLS